MTDTKILITEDELIVADDLRMTLRQMGYQVMGIATTASEAIALTSKTQPNLVLMDIKLRGHHDGIHAASEIRRHFDVPVVFLTAHADEDTIHRAGRVLPYGYLVKPYEENELRAGIEMALRLHQAQNQFSRLERFLSTTLASIAEGVIAVDLQGKVCYMNTAAERLVCWSSKEAFGKPWREVFPLLHEETRMPVEDVIARVVQVRSVVRLPAKTVLVTRKKMELNIQDCAAPIVDDRGNLTGVVITFRDRTEELRNEREKKRVETRLLQTQKLESLGLLAGSFAHDFNNILASVIPSAELLEKEFAEDSSQREYAANIKQAGLNAAELCHQILTYAGQAKKCDEKIDLNLLVTQTINLVHASISKQARLDLDLNRLLPRIQGNSGQLRQLIMNLVINASDALEGKPGAVSVKTFEGHAAKEWFQSALIGVDCREGSYVFFKVQDTGCGMSAETIGKIFDPFFTTKYYGRGLGLAAAHGIIRAHNGALRVDSVVGQGTTFILAFPANLPPSESIESDDFSDSSWKGHGKVLLVDDDTLVRDAMRHVLQSIGFLVLAASDGLEAMEIIHAEGNSLNLLLADYTMPNMDGIELMRQCRQVLPDLPVVLMSGLTDVATNLQPAEAKSIIVLHKPFTTSVLRGVLRQAMEVKA